MLDGFQMVRWPFSDAGWTGGPAALWCPSVDLAETCGDLLLLEIKDAAHNFWFLEPF